MQHTLVCSVIVALALACGNKSSGDDARGEETGGVSWSGGSGGGTTGGVGATGGTGGTSGGGGSGGRASTGCEPGTRTTCLGENRCVGTIGCRPDGSGFGGECVCVGPGETGGNGGAAGETQNGGSSGSAAVPGHAGAAAAGGVDTSGASGAAAIPASGAGGVTG